MRRQVERARRAATSSAAALAGSNRVRFAWPDGAFYLFFAVDGHRGHRARSALGLVDEAGIGLAPGSAFGAGRRALHAALLRAQGGRPDRGDAAARRLARKLTAPVPAGVDRRIAPRASPLTLAISAAGGFAAKLLGLPAGWISGGLLAVAVASLAGVNTDIPRSLRTRRSSSCSASIPAAASRRRRSHQMQTWPASFAHPRRLGRRG